MKKPEYIDYNLWLHQTRHVYLDQQIKSHYEESLEYIKEQFEKSQFWTELRNNIKLYNQECYSKYGYNLFYTEKMPEIDKKEFASLKEKTYRLNILKNSSFPKPPDGEWILPDNWFQRINDNIRTTFVVIYLDGVEFLKEKIDELCRICGGKTECCYIAKDDGYYSLHIYIEQEFEIIKLNLEKTNIFMPVEIQIKTQLQEYIKQLLHIYYEKSRVSLVQDESWKWKYGSNEFKVNYLGHMLHYIEGMVIDIYKKEKAL